MQLVLHYDGTGFSGWQRQPDARTVQGEIEASLERLCASPVPVLGAGRTDAGVHARGQAAGVIVPDRWTAFELRRALNAVLPHDIWIANAFEMRVDFHARYSAISREYSYQVGTDETANSPFRKRYALAWNRPIDVSLLKQSADEIAGEHSFRAFAVRGTAPAEDEHRCIVSWARWIERPGGWSFSISANRFLHHMVRFLVGTMLDVAGGKRPVNDVRRLLSATDNREVSAPVPPHALFLERVEYPRELYLPIVK